MFIKIFDTIAGTVKTYRAAVKEKVVCRSETAICVRAVEPFVKGTENEVAIDIKSLRGATNGVVTIDPGYKNTGSCTSAITFLDGEKGILRYRGYAIEELAEKAD